MLLSDQLKAANILFKALDYKQAIVSYTSLMEVCTAHSEGRSAVELAPEESKEDVQKTFMSALLNRCSCYCQSNEWTSGLNDALAAKSVAPLDPRVPVRTAIAHQGLRQHLEAMHVCRAGLDAHPNDTSLLNLLARSEAALGMPRSAVPPLWSPLSQSQFHSHNHGHSHEHEHGHSHEHEHSSRLVGHSQQLQRTPVMGSPGRACDCAISACAIS